MNKVELRLVPLWVQRALEASGLGLGDALDSDKISSILSTRDLDFYYKSQCVLESSFFFRMVCGSFQNFSGDKEPEKPRDLSNEELADFLYGYIPMGDVRNSTPAYTSSIHGKTDTIIVSVVTGSEAEQFCKHMFMKRIIGQMIAFSGIDQVAPTPIFKEWIQGVD